MDAATCRRFLAARKGDPKAAERMLHRYAKWRQEARPAEITAAEVRREVATRKAYAHGVDRGGRALIWVFASRHDKTKRDLDEMSRFIPFCMEQAIRFGEAQGTEKVCIFFDLSGFGLRCMDYELVKRLMHILANYYPERLGQVLLWNGPALFNVFWRIVKSWMDPVTVEKIKPVSGKELADFVEPSNYPSEVALRLGTTRAA